MKAFAIVSIIGGIGVLLGACLVMNADGSPGVVIVLFGAGLWVFVLGCCLGATAAGEEDAIRARDTAQDGHRQEYQQKLAEAEKLRKVQQLIKELRRE